MSITIAPLRAVDWEQFRELRLRALADSPLAFGTTWAEANEQPQTYWQSRARDAEDGLSGTMFVAVSGEDCVGLTGVFLGDDVPNRADIVSVWVDPGYRRRGIARSLVEAAVTWARAKGCREAELWVTASNLAARLLYRALGFVDTGERQPLRWDQSVVQAKMLWRFDRS